MDIKLGIIGAGQLGMYLCQAARRLGITTTLFAEEADMPAVPFADHIVIGPLDDPDSLASFLATSDVVTFDKEDIPDQSLAAIKRAQEAGDVVSHPDVDTLSLIKDKGLQKQWLADQDFPTLPYRLVDSATPNAELEEAFGLPLVQKARRGGYDGMGVQIIDDLAERWDTPSVIETFLADCREISILLARGRDGQVEVYPPLGMAFDENLNALSTVITPADIPEALGEEALALASDIITRLNEVGIYAVEMFIDPDDRLWVNEISPRVHNSGHLTKEAASASQFEQHVRAAVGLPLVEVKMTASASAMVNVLYEDKLESVCPDSPIISRSSDSATTVYWYGKEPGRQGRKMGHIVALAETAEEAARLAQERLAKLPEDDRDKAA